MGDAQVNGSPSDLTPALNRCSWVGTDPLMIAYHDHEWGVPVYAADALFERLMLECFQAGLSWSTVLRKRENFRAAFDNWDPARIANYGDSDIARLLSDEGIIRNRAKIRAAIGNARAFLELEAAGGFSAFVWSFVGGGPRVFSDPPPSLDDIRSTSTESDIMSKALKKLGFSFVGSTICYAFMQSVGMVNDHTADCFRATEPSRERRLDPSRRDVSIMGR
jgi:DNA-3-methyladenine glycosylase I